MAAGIIIGVLGLWILLRTISSGNQGQGNLADVLMGLGGSSSSPGNSPGSSSTPAAPVTGTPPGNPKTNLQGNPGGSLNPGGAPRAPAAPGKSSPYYRGYNDAVAGRPMSNQNPQYVLGYSAGYGRATMPA